jgi:hypothetical protein
MSVDGTPMWRKVMRDGVLHCLPRYEHDEWAERCSQQKNQLMADFARYAALLGEEDPQDAQAPGIVGTPAPLKPGKKRPRYLEIHGREIDAFTLTRN